MADSEVITTETSETTTIKTEISSEPPKEETVTSVTEKITVRKSPIPTPAPASSVAPAPAPAPKPSGSETYSKSVKKSSSDYSSYKSGSYKRQTFREYVDTNRLLSDLSRDYRGTSPAVLENIATHPALYSKQYMPDRYRPTLSARSRKVIRDAEDLALVTPGLKHMLEVQYHIWLCFSVCLLRFDVICALLTARAISFIIRLMLKLHAE